MEARKDDDACWKEYRRHVGVKLLSEGWRQEDVATFLEVDQSTVCNWHKRSEADPEHGLRDKPISGRPPDLTEEMKAAVLYIIFDLGPVAFGFKDEKWSCRRVADAIRRLTGVNYHPSHVSLLLREYYYSYQKPATKAIQRDEATIMKWLEEEWPKIVKTLSKKAND